MMDVAFMTEDHVACLPVTTTHAANAPVMTLQRVVRLTFTT